MNMKDLTREEMAKKAAEVQRIKAIEKKHRLEPWARDAELMKEGLFQPSSVARHATTNEDLSNILSENKANGLRLYQMLSNKLDKLIVYSRVLLAVLVCGLLALLLKKG